MKFSDPSTFTRLSQETQIKGNLSAVLRAI
jgi:hypothetical protein